MKFIEDEYDETAFDEECNIYHIIKTSENDQK